MNAASRAAATAREMLAASIDCGLCVFMGSFPWVFARVPVRLNASYVSITSLCLLGQYHDTLHEAHVCIGDRVVEACRARSSENTSSLPLDEGGYKVRPGRGY